MKYCLFLFLFLPFINTFGQEAAFDALLNDLYSAAEPGGTAVVAKEGKIIYNKAFGMANLELGIPMRPEMVFQIGSITKQFTAVAILMLVEQDKLDLDDDITKFIPDYPTQGYHISIHHLLTHTSGIKSYTSKEEWYELWRNDMEPMEMIDFFKSDSLEFHPGEDWAYNNSAYFMLGYIIEVASGKTYGEFIEENIFTPLEMNNSRYGSTSEIIPNRAYGYQENEEENFVNAEYLSLSQAYAAGAIMSTVGDLYTWNKAVHNEELVSKESLEIIFTNHKPISGSGYGYGWGLSSINGSPTYEHSGGIFGFVTNAVYLPQEDVFVAVFSNCDCRGPVEASTKIAALAIDKPYPTKNEGIKLKTAVLEKWVGVYQYSDSTLFEATTDGDFLMVRDAGDENDTLYALSKNTFAFDDDITQLVFTESNDTVYATLTYRLYEEPTMRVNREMPSMEIDEEVLEQYVGVYTVASKYEFNIYIEEGKLMAEMTGQDPVELTPESETVFGIPGMEGKVEFLEKPSGTFNQIEFRQGLIQMKAERK